MTYQDQLSERLRRNGNTGVTGGALNTLPLETPGLQAPINPVGPNGATTDVADTPMPPSRRSFDDVYGALGSRGVRTQHDMARVFQENPNDFAGWSIHGSKGDKLKGEDGSVYDVIRNAGLGGQGLQRHQDAGPGGVPIQRPQTGGGGGGGMGPLSMQGGLAGLLTGDPTQAIQAALGQQSEQGGYLANLLKQLGVR